MIRYPGSDKPWTSADAGPDALKRMPAVEYNKDPILAVLRDILPDTGTFLEIASGTGEHLVHFAPHWSPKCCWIPSDPDPACRRSIIAWTKLRQISNIARPLDLDVLSEKWSVDPVDGMLCINMIHISPWEATEGLFRHAARLLPPGAPLYIYGPFLQRDVETAPSNLRFDESLRERNAEWGIRLLEDVDAVAARHAFARDQRVEMPANNLSLIYRRD